MPGSYEWGRIYGIPIRVHITLIILLPLLALHLAAVLRTSTLWGLLAAAGLFGSVALHELGHSVIALSKGIRVREILLLPIGGIAQLESMPDRFQDELHIAAAGPLVSLVLALGCMIAGMLVGAAGLASLSLVLRVLGLMNLFLALFNLLPSFPMDGGRIFRAWMTPRVGRVEATRIAVKIGRFMALVFGFFALLQFNLVLLAIAIFIYMAAGAEYRMVLMQDAARRGSSPWPYHEPAWPREQEDLDVRVSPPPYAHRKPSSPYPLFGDMLRKQRELFNDLFRNS